VLDTHVLLEMLLWQSPRHQHLREAQAAGAIRLLASPATMAEWLHVLARPALGLASAEIEQAHARYLACHQLGEVEPDDIGLPRCRDADDQKFLRLAYFAGAQALLTRDKKLLKIGKHRIYKARFRVQSPEQYASERTLALEMPERA
jgi:putative PIN family toxin of toxin-antitoxin system